LLLLVLLMPRRDKRLVLLQLLLPVLLLHSCQAVQAIRPERPCQQHCSHDPPLRMQLTAAGVCKHGSDGQQEQSKQRTTCLSMAHTSDGTRHRTCCNLPGQ
jgi:hypothetical protein